jgi:N-acetylglucosamine kinase-like BadF-type ATPase
VDKVEGRVDSGFLLGVDVGGTGTRALITDSAGRILGFGVAGPGNHEMVGYEGLFRAMQEALATAVRDAHLRFLGAGFGVAGFDWESERADTLAAIAKLGLRCPIVLKNDAALGLAAGSSEGWGVNVSAGTSNNCYGKARSLEGSGEMMCEVIREGSIAGAGAALGENGGAAEIVQAALIAINHARILRGPATTLGAALCARSGARNADALIEGLACGTIVPQAVWAGDVFATARAGDPVALHIIDWAGRELGESAAAVARQVGIQDQAFEVVLSGSLFGLEPPLETGLAAVLARKTPGARIVRLDAPPVTGAVILAAEEAGLDRGAFRPVLLDSCKSLSYR